MESQAVKWAPTVFLIPLVALTLGTISATTVRAQGGVRAWGLGGALTAAARGLEAVQYNPANLALDRGTSLGLASAAVMVGNNSLSLDRYNEINGSYLDTADKDLLMADIPAEGFRLDADVRVSAAGFRSGPFAFTLGARGQGRGNLDRDYFDLALYGNQVDQKVDFSNTWGGGYAVGMATISWGTALLRKPGSTLAVGCNLHYLQGLYEIHIAHAGGTLDTSLADIDGQAYVDALSAEGGTGYGLDLGLAWQRGNWDLALAVDNVRAAVDWDKGLQEDSYSITATAVTLLDGELDTAVIDRHDTRVAAPYRTHLPRSYRLGIAHRTGSLLTSADLAYEEGVTADQPSRSRAAAGAEYRLVSWLTPRVGLRLDEFAGTGGSIGLGIGAGPWRIDAAAMTTGGLMPGSAKGFGAAVGTYVSF